MFESGPACARLFLTHAEENDGEMRWERMINTGLWCWCWWCYDSVAKGKERMHVERERKSGAQPLEKRQINPGCLWGRRFYDRKVKRMERMDTVRGENREWMKEEELMLLSNQEQLPHQLHPMAWEQADSVQGSGSAAVINEWSVSLLTPHLISPSPSLSLLFISWQRWKQPQRLRYL